MTPLAYYAEPRLVQVAAIAAAAWNKALRRPVLVPANSDTRIFIRFGRMDRTRDATRVAQHTDRAGVHTILLATDRKWAITKWQRFWGIGDENALAALLHEFGHALGLPHSSNTSDVMAPDLGSTVISDYEAAGYRTFLNLA